MKKSLYETPEEKEQKEENYQKENNDDNNDINDNNQENLNESQEEDEYEEFTIKLSMLYFDQCDPKKSSWFTKRNKIFKKLWGHTPNSNRKKNMFHRRP